MENKVILKRNKGVLTSIYVKCEWFEKELDARCLRELNIEFEDFFYNTKRSYIIFMEKDIEFKLYFRNNEIKDIETDELYLKVLKLEKELKDIKNKMK